METRKKEKIQRAIEVEGFLNSVAWLDIIKPEFDKLIEHYYKLLVEANLSVEPIEVIDPSTGIQSVVSPTMVAARIEGLRFALHYLEGQLKEAAKSKVEVVNE